MNGMKTIAETAGWRIVLIIMVMSSFAFLAFGATGGGFNNNLPPRHHVKSASYSNMSGAYRSTPSQAVIANNVLN